MVCECALSILLSLSYTNLQIDGLYGQPYHCVQGSFHYDPKNDALVFRRKRHHSFEQAIIPLPHPNVQGQVHIMYCWGSDKARVGTDEVQVVFAWRKSPHA